MQAAVKFTGPKASALAHLGKTKLLELMSEDDDDLDALAEGGTLAGHTLDEIDRMSSRELREALRKERTELQQTTEANDKLFADKDAKLNELARQLDREPVLTSWPQLAERVNIETATAAYKGLLACQHLDELRDQILNGDYEGLSLEDSEQAVEMMAVHYLDVLAQLHAKIGELRDNGMEVFEGYKIAAEEREQNLSDNPYKDINEATVQ